MLTHGVQFAIEAATCTAKYIQQVSNRIVGPNFHPSWTLETESPRGRETPRSTMKLSPIPNDTRKEIREP